MQAAGTDLHPLQIPYPRRRLYGDPGECEIGTKPAGTKAAKGGTVHVILLGLKGPDTLWASSCGRNRCWAPLAHAPAPPPQPPPTGPTINAHNGSQ